MWNPWRGIEPVAVYDESLWPYAQSGNGTVHGEERGMKDVNLIDFLGCHYAYRPRHGIALYLLAKGVATLLGQFLRVVELRIVVVGRQDDGCRINAASQATTPGLIAPCLNQVFIIMWQQHDKTIRTSC